MANRKQLTNYEENHWELLMPGAGGKRRVQRLVNPGAQKRKTALKSSGRSLQSSETFVSELSFRTSSVVTAQGTVASPARLPQPFQVAPDD